MTNKKVIIGLFGKSCSGKSSLINELAERMHGFYIIAYDRVKRQFAGYHRDHHKALIKELTFDFFEVVCEKGLPVLADSLVSTEEEYQRCLKVTKKYDYQFFAVNLTAPPGVLLERFRERVKEVKEKGKKISVMDEDLFLENQKINFYVPPNTKTFDTSKMSPQEIAEKVVRELGLI